jgi:diguanylate cyclase (GGDEF)-like protein
VNKDKALVAGALLAGAAAWARFGGSTAPPLVRRLEASAPADEHPQPPEEPAAELTTDHAATLQYLVDHDQLTGLRNRHGFERVLGEALTSANGSRPGALVKFGMDNFRHLNASRGRETCDLVLTSVASLVASVTLEEGAAGRIGGDTFAVFLPKADREQAEAVSRHVLASVEAADLDVEHGGIRATMSAGITLLDSPEMTPGDALLEADLAMARAKSAGRARIAVYTPAELRPFKATRQWAEEIQRALESSSLELHCQPVRSMRGSHVQWELLVRLPQPDGQLLPPASFLPTAQRFGFLERVDAWVVERACDLVEEHGRAGRRLDLEVNVSPRSLADEGFVELVAQRLTRSGIDAGALIFEVSEAMAVESLDEVRVFADQLKALGCRFALDNFGTRHASLTHLKHLPIDFVKIDGAFIRHLADDECDQRIVRAVIELAHGLDQRVIAAFVGDGQTLELLRAYGADYVQGFFVGRPRPIAELE